jgi:2-dehydro-3-deoxy-D-arabinonate dehydratase
VAERPELFFKAPGWRVRGEAAAIGIRSDSAWNVPEPELGLVVDARGALVAYTVGNDVSSRSIEGENPLYLPQAKVYDDALGLSGTIVLARELGDAVHAAAITLRLERAGATVFEGATSVAEMARSFDVLVEHLFRELSHPAGVVLLTGTGVVPPDDVTLQDGDVVELDVEGVGRLRHAVYRGG